MARRVFCNPRVLCQRRFVFGKRFRMGAKDSGVCIRGGVRPVALFFESANPVAARSSVSDVAVCDRRDVLYRSPHQFVSDFLVDGVFVVRAYVYRADSALGDCRKRFYFAHTDMGNVFSRANSPPKIFSPPWRLASRRLALPRSWVGSLIKSPTKATRAKN